MNEKIEIILTKNSEEILKKLEDCGFYICQCCRFNYAIWLSLFNRSGKLEIHGMGYPDEWNPNYKWENEEAIKDCEHSVIGALQLDYEIHIFNDLDKFITFIKDKYGEL